MSLNLEERLGDHLRDRAESDPTHTDQLTQVKVIARRKTMRNRVAAGVCGLIALGGAASLVPNGEDSSALITAADPTAVEVPEPIDVAPEEPDERTSQDDADSEPQAVDADADRTNASSPPPHRIVGDGQGGFAAISVTSRGSTSFVRSDDGIDWFEAGGAQFDDNRVLTELRFVDGSFAAVLDVQRPAGTGGGFIDPQLAISTDLVDWRLIDFAFDNPDGKARMHIGEIAITPRQVVVRTSEIEQVAAAPADLDIRDLCGGSRTGEAATITLCSGEIVPAADGFDYAPAARRFVVEERGAGTFSEMDGGTPIPQTSLFHGGPGVVRFIQLDADGFSDPGDGEESTADSTEVADSVDDFKLIALRSKADGRAVGLVRDGDQLQALWTDSRETSFMPLPREITVNPQDRLFPQLVEGAAGWAALIFDGDTGYRSIEQDGWTLQGYLPALSVELRNEETDEYYWYNTTGPDLPPNVEQSLFGDTRFFRPGTDEVVFEASGDDVRSSSAALLSREYNLPPTEEFDQELTVDGWTLSGDPLRGPLVLTSPEGGETVYSDGFAFANGDTSDGVEADVSLATGSFLRLRPATEPITFYEAGEAVAAFAVVDILDTLAIPVISDPNGGVDRSVSLMPIPVTEVGWLLHSPDGKEWSVVQEVTGSDIRDARIALGDDEILLLERSGATRIELDN